MQIGFIDFSKEERNKILATIKMLDGSGTVDELGVGVVRDAYSDILFPGFSVIQTRAKYFVLIPYLFNLASKQNFSSGGELYKWIHLQEDKLAKTLVDNSDDGETGIIGRRSLKQKKEVKLKPSYIYWNGLRTFEILKNPSLSLTSACNLTYHNSRKRADFDIISDGETFDDITAIQGNSVIFSPIKSDYDFMKEANINLTKKEAQYIEQKMLNSALSKNTLLSFLIKNKLLCNSFDDIPIDILPDNLKNDYLLAKEFSDFIVGAHIRYNVIFSENEDEDMIDQWNQWRNQIISRVVDLDKIFNRINVNISVLRFCELFLKAVQENNITAIDEIIISREKALKGDRSKLKKPLEYRYNHDRPIHFYKMNYRYGRVKIIIEDIFKGLEDDNV